MAGGDRIASLGKRIRIWCPYIKRKLGAPLEEEAEGKLVLRGETPKGGMDQGPSSTTRKGLRYRLSVYLGIGLCMILPTVVLGRHDLVPIFVGLYLPGAILTEFGTVRIISRHGGVENARRRGFRERLVVYSVMTLCWIPVLALVGWFESIPIIIGVNLPLMVLFDLLFIYRIFSRPPRNSSGTRPSP